jgi:hypothetical protein
MTMTRPRHRPPALLRPARSAGAAAGAYAGIEARWEVPRPASHQRP